MSRFHDVIGGPVGQQRLQRRRVQPVAAAIGRIASDELGAGKREIPDRVQRLVTDEFVAEPQPFAIDDRVVVADHHGILQRGSERMAGCP